MNEIVNVAPSNPVIPDLLYTEIEDEVRDGVKNVLDKRSSWPSTLERTESQTTTDTELWHSLAVDVGLAGLAISDEAGGAGASWREVAVVLEELGRRSAAVPFLGHAVTATALLVAIGGHELLARAALGESVFAVAVPMNFAAWNAPATRVTAENGRVSGSVRSVSDAASADVLLVPVGDDLFAVDAGDAVVTPVVSLDMTRQLVDIEFDSAAAELISSGAERAVDHALVVSAALLASEQLGLAEEALRITVEYLKERRQFGRVLGSYQALKHRLADLWVEITNARAVARYAAACAAENSDDLEIASTLAHSLCSRVAVKAAEECVQLHGGIGFTWEHPAHLLLKRAKSSASMFGGIDRHREHLGVLVGMTTGSEQQ
ncbi:acyl-CoA/acyl-ACP dehydrogenase [Rhodococcus fascians]|nr:acyl-CoA/acyl-ACP dehydrogenase [Rhodococcus fascians]MBY4237966.1 acyl-CoA/acyl-ACP dehydrogenase [Rhodococcus fascians]MBY4253283.1 acyl-CoA/acyl-ACP dehydrogenase [Rhodococcus fascians]MBY4268920.1 acyl-CoA/acyl-ACP dehydrogenase [Rhodococcus fascians]